MREQTNEQWLAELRGPNPDEALADLYDLLVRGLRVGLGNYGGGVDANAEDFAQEALIKITGNLDSFRGEQSHSTVDHLAFTIALSDYEAEKRRLEELGLSVTTATHEWVHWRSLHLKDPDGNEVELVCYDPKA